ncbi:MAG: hypothetical protein JO153_05560 [Solirubrobacterales bacterium]|nr:hypothetical protein [Solirubrobacterales bacterium]MBV9915954.1 hypothetical protein [Solirubrobacterales bacterium]
MADRVTGPSPHAHRFRIAIAALVGIAIGAIAVALVVIASNGSSTDTATKWSDWSPPDDGVLGAREIANHVAPFYRISSVDQLDVVTVVNLSSASPSSASASGSSSSNATSNSSLQVAVRSDPSSSQVSLLGGKTIAYNLCGIGSSNCTIGAGKPSPDRLLLLRREALELALYTFKYISGIQNVVAILPPGHTVQGCTGICPNPHVRSAVKPVDIALLFVRDELKPWLTQPLSYTFPERFPPSVPELSLWKQTPEAGLVAQITERGLFSEQLVQTQDGSNLIVLDPQPPQ